MEYLNDIWINLLPMINWVIFILVIASGYFIRVTPILKKYRHDRKRPDNTKRTNRVLF